MTLNKGAFVDKLASATGLSNRDARKVLDAVIELITDTLSSNEEILLTGFGKFELRTREQSPHVDPGTRKRIAASKKVVPVFKPGKNLKDIVAKEATKRPILAQRPAEQDDPRPTKRRRRRGR